jgi:PAS domain S-box-containing protein
MSRTIPADQLGDERFFELSLDLLCVVGFDGYLKRVNPAWERTLGWQADELTARPYGEFIHVEDRQRTLDEAARLAEPGAETRDWELRFITGDGEWKWLVFSAQGDAEAGVIYAVGKDITERKEAEAELRHRAEALERSNAELEQFAYVASHDLSEPLRMISGFVELLRDRYRGRLDSDADEFIDYTIDGVERMQKLIEDLLAYSRVGQQTEDGDVELDAVLREATRALGAVLAESRAVLEADPLPVVFGDRRELTQLMQNLLSNAIKFVEEPPPRVHLSAQRRDGMWVVAVADNGIGIAPRHADRIFKMFQRLHSRESYPGTGIGLAICKKIVERRGGTIAVTPRDGGGSVFRVTLPPGREAAA